MARWNSMAAFAGGASVGLIASRLLPPLLAQASSGDVFELLEDDHRRFLALLQEMERAEAAGTAQRLQLLLRLKRGLAAHAMAEEDVIYPLLSEQVGAAKAAERLYGEHGIIKTHLYALERNIGDPAVWRQRAAELRRVVADHARAEEQTEFPRLRAVLDPDAAARVARHVRREKALIL